ncbi:MAG: DNA-binding protein [Methanospirillum sp.]|nr:DNA-binding protein [Methanospirillum sp.]
MGDDELAEIRRRKMAEIQQQTAMQQQEIDRQQQYEAQMQMALMQVLEPEARERLSTIRLTRPDFARAVEQQLVMLAQNGRIQKKITDEQLKVILKQVTPAKKEFNIRRKG